MEALLLAPVSLGFISAILGALISVTDSVVNNYGEVDININNGKKSLKVKGGSPLLGTLAEKDIFIPSACGGRGSCGACKVQVLSDVGPHLPTEIPYLTKEEQAQNVRLSCQIKLKAGIEIQIPEALFNIRKLKTKVKKITSVTHDIREVLLEVPEGTDLPYVPGQYGQFEVPPYDKIKEPTQRAYSFSSNPNDKKHLEFLIRLVPGGIVTSYVHQHLKEGQTINVVAPVGEFHVHDTGAQMICVAGGSGMAPFKSIFANMVDSGEIDKREVWYFFGARTTKDIFYLDWLSELEKKYPTFHFIAALSEPQEGDGWTGETGLITDVLHKYLTTVISEGNKEGYLCGSPGMLDACMAVMRKNNMQEDKIYFDKFA
ncbi:MAG: 2Fe-2S iron-sulfur cluster binding domain-containing protein [Spirochaetales bacterium]|nr:2Fe-2S iron-sulfur cluster binding domain-containing protein [Spirochaetales bacterium]